MPKHGFRPTRELLRDITPEDRYLRRREFLRGAVGVASGVALAGCLRDEESHAADSAGADTTQTDASHVAAAQARSADPDALGPLVSSPYSKLGPNDVLSEEDDATSYNNFYEFGTGKDDPARNAHSLRTRPWSVAVEGAVGRPGSVPIEDLLRPHALEERVYRLRCVEAWSMVIPWIGIPLGDILKRFDPTSRAKYVEFETLNDPEQMPGLRRRVLDWPYREGLRIDEAMNPLAILAVGMYGKVLPNQNGAPLRLIVPWKYGFKSIKSIVRIHLREDMPPTSWNQSQPNEYGFYANVNPAVDHPRWSQKRERRIGEFRKRPTLPFNGYAEEVASLYTGMDLTKLF